MRHHGRILKIALLFHTIQNKSEKKYSCYDDAYYEILGEEQYELHTRWLWRRLWKGIISLSSKSTAIQIYS